MRLARTIGILLAATLLLTACGGSTNTTTGDVESAPADTATLPAVDLPPTATTVPEAEVTATAAALASGSAESAPLPVDAAPSAGVITVGVNAEFEPFLFKDANGTLAGIDIDLLNALSAEANLEVAYVDTTFSDLLAGVAEGRFDAGMAGITVTPERAQSMLFTEPYFTTDQAPVSFLSAGQSLAVPSASTIGGAADITPEMSVGVKQGTTGETFARENLDAEIVTYPESTILLGALQAGEIDAVVLDSAVIADFIFEHPDTIRLAGGTLVQEAYAIAVAPGQESLVERLNSALAAVRADGRYSQIMDKWMAQ